MIRDSRAEAQRVFEKLFEANGRAPLWTNQPVGTPAEVAEAIRPYLEIGPGYRHLLAGFPAPYDEESMTRFATEVRPRSGARAPELTRGGDGGRQTPGKRRLRSAS